MFGDHECFFSMSSIVFGIAECYVSSVEVPNENVCSSEVASDDHGAKG